MLMSLALMLLLQALSCAIVSWVVVLVSPATTSKVNIVSLMGSRQVAIDEEEQVGCVLWL
jgi:hypothetical protein